MCIRDRMKMRIEIGIKEIRERKFFIQQREERRANFADEIEGLAPITIAAMRAELELDYVSHGYVVDVFELLRL
eukprot:1772605-Prymnesium_polylepis.1